MRCGIYLPTIQLPPRRTGSRTASASSSLRRFHRISKTINKSGGSPTESRRGNRIKQGKFAYLHRGRRRRCTCGRGRPMPRSTASRSPRTPRSWLLLAARLDLLPRPAPSKSRGQITPATRSNRSDSAASDRADAGGEFDGDGDPRGWAWGNWEVASTLFDRVRRIGGDGYERD
jgi:hypothetical protein